MSAVNERTATGERVVVAIRRGVWRWAVYYGDGSMYWSDEVGTTWDRCPDDDVQVVLQFRLSPRGDRLWCDLLTGDDEYRLEGYDHVKYGRQVDDEVYDAICDRAQRAMLREFERYQDERRARGERGD